MVESKKRVKDKSKCKSAREKKKKKYWKIKKKLIENVQEMWTRMRKARKSKKSRVQENKNYSGKQIENRTEATNLKRIKKEDGRQEKELRKKTLKDKRNTAGERLKKRVAGSVRKEQEKKLTELRVNKK